MGANGALSSKRAGAIFNLLRRRHLQRAERAVEAGDQRGREAFGRVHRSSTCPPVDDVCSATDDGQWFCSQAVPGGIYRCPDRAASMVFCPKRSPCVQPEEGFSTGDVEAVKHAFCTSSKDFDPR